MRVMEKSARNAIFKGFFQNSLLGTFESKQTLRQQIKKQTFPKATFQRILRILLGNQVYHTEDAYQIAKGGALGWLVFDLRRVHHVVVGSKQLKGCVVTPIS